MKTTLAVLVMMAATLSAQAQPIPVWDMSKVAGDVLDYIGRASAAQAAIGALAQSGQAVAVDGGSIDVGSNGTDSYLVRAMSKTGRCFVTVKKLGGTPQHGVIPMKATDVTCVQEKAQ